LHIIKKYFAASKISNKIVLIELSSFFRLFLSFENNKSFLLLISEPLYDILLA
jgi:hypothetical protein